MSTYNVAKEGKPYGKLTQDEIWAALSKGELSPSDLVWKSGMAQWQKIKDVSELSLGIVEASTVSALNAEPELVESEEPGSLEEQGEGSPKLVKEASSFVMPAWERKEDEGFFRALFLTVKEVMLSPQETFASMPKQGALGKPWGFYMVWATFCFFATILMQVVFASPALMQASSEGQSVSFFALAIAVVVGLGFTAIGPFITAGVLHISLKLVSGAKTPYETTFRVACYGQAPTLALSVIPLLNIVGAIWSVVSTVIGLSEVNQISRGRALLAFFLPTLVACLCIGTIFALALPAIMAAASR